MDLLSVVVKNPIEVHLKAVEGMAGFEPNQPLYDGETPVKILLHHAGVYSDKWQNESNRQRKARENGTVQSAEVQREAQAKLYASVITGWTGIDQPFNYENAIALLKPVESAWIRLQIDAALSEAAKKQQPN